MLEDERGRPVVIEAATSWGYVGAGLRISMELLGPEYSMEVSTLNTPLKIFLSSDVKGSEGEDLVEKQNSERASCPWWRTRPLPTAILPKTATWWKPSAPGSGRSRRSPTV